MLIRRHQRNPGKYGVSAWTVGQPHINVGSEIEIPNNKIRWDRGNPTGHGIVFLSRAGYVFCYVQPGGV